MMPAKKAIQLRDWLIDHSAELEQAAAFNGLVDVIFRDDSIVLRVIHESGKNERIGAFTVPSGVLMDIP
jgi:hypothetical protein